MKLLEEKLPEIIGQSVRKLSQFLRNIYLGLHSIKVQLKVLWSYVVHGKMKNQQKRFLKTLEKTANQKHGSRWYSDVSAGHGYHNLFT